MIDRYERRQITGRHKNLTGKLTGRMSSLEVKAGIRKVR